MGFFDKWRKNKQDSLPPSQPLQADGGTNGEPRRFTFLVEDTFQLKNGGVVVTGKVRGTMRAGDGVSVIKPGGGIFRAAVGGLEYMAAPGQMQRAAEVTDSFAGVLLASIRDKAQIPKYSLLTSIQPQASVDGNTAVENPYILGLSYEYERFRGDTDFCNSFLQALTQAHFLVPVSLKSAPAPDGSGKWVFPENSETAFPYLKHPEEKGQLVLPVFTDRIALRRWRALFEGQQPVQVAVCGFSDFSMLARKESGLVINPFHQWFVFLSRPLLDNVMESEGYRQSLAAGAKAAVTPITLKKGASILLGVPKETDEVRFIRQAIGRFCQRDEAIEAVYLLLKIVEESNEASYLCVIDRPEGVAPELFGALYKELKPYGAEIPLFDFVGRSDAASLEQNLTQEALAYRKGTASSGDFTPPSIAGS